MVCSYNGRIFGIKYLFVLQNLDEPWKNAKWKEPLTKDYVLYDV